MPRYWVIAPFASADSNFFDRVWQFDLSNGHISIGWPELGDISQLDKAALQAAVAKTYPSSPPATRTLYANMLWAFHHEISPGDVVLARRGRKVLAAVGDVSRAGYFSKGRNPILSDPSNAHSHFLDIRWRDAPRDLQFPTIVFPMHTLMELSENQFQGLLGGNTSASPIAEAPEVTADANSFALEKYLEDFIVSNFASIFKGELQLYTDPQGADGQQFSTDIGVIDILAVEPKTGCYVVIELKKGRPSDQVVGQVLRYMGWVQKNLCAQGQQVKGLVICKEQDPRLSYALAMVTNVRVKYYSVSFSLRDAA